MLKKCSKCASKKELTEFYKNKKGKFGVKSICKSCEKQDRKQYCKDNKEEVKERMKQYYQDNKEQIKECSKQYYQDNKEQVNQYCKQYYKDNKEQIKQYYKKHSREYNDILSELFNNEVKYVTYIVKSDNFYKIGFTRNLYSRLKTLKQDIFIKNIYVLNKNIEKRLLRELSNYQYDIGIDFDGKTECFNFSNDIFEFIINNNGFKEFK